MPFGNRSRATKLPAPPEARDALGPRTARHRSPKAIQASAWCDGLASGLPAVACGRLPVPVAPPVEDRAREGRKTESRRRLVVGRWTIVFQKQAAVPSLACGVFSRTVSDPSNLLLPNGIVVRRRSSALGVVLVGENLQGRILCGQRESCSRSSVSGLSKRKGATKLRAAKDAKRVSGELDSATAPAVVLMRQVVPYPGVAGPTRVEAHLVWLQDLEALDDANLFASRSEDVGNDTRRPGKMRNDQVTDESDGDDPDHDPGRKHARQENGLKNFHFEVRERRLTDLSSATAQQGHAGGGWPPGCGQRPA